MGVLQYFISSYSFNLLVVPLTVVFAYYIYSAIFFIILEEARVKLHKLKEKNIVNLLIMTLLSFPRNKRIHSSIISLFDEFNRSCDGSRNQRQNDKSKLPGRKFPDIKSLFFRCLIIIHLLNLIYSPSLDSDIIPNHLINY